MSLECGYWFHIITPLIRIKFVDHLKFVEDDDVAVVCHNFYAYATADID